MSKERDAELVAKAKEYAELLDQIDELTRKRCAIETAEMNAHNKRRELETKLSGFVGRSVQRRAVHLGLRSLVIEWQSETSEAGIHLVETVSG